MSYFPYEASPTGYFPTGYFPTADAQAEGTTLDLLSEISLWFPVQAPLEAIADALYLDAPADGGITPYVVLRQSSTSLERSSSTSRIYDTRIEFIVYADDQDTAEDLAILLESAIKDQTFTWIGGQASPFVPFDQRAMREPARAELLGRVWTSKRTFQTRVKVPI